MHLLCKVSHANRLLARSASTFLSNNMGQRQCSAVYNTTLHKRVDQTSRCGVTAGLGFEDCSARVEFLQDTALNNHKPFVQEHQQVASRGWAYYAFNVTDDDYQVVVNVAEEEYSKCKHVWHDNAWPLSGMAGSICANMLSPASACAQRYVSWLG